jgi:putative transposase
MSAPSFTAEQKATIVLEGVASGEITELCRRHGISTTTYYNWKEAALKAMVRGLGPGNHTSEELLEKENEKLKQIVGDLTLANDLFKKLQTPRRGRRWRG